MRALQDGLVPGQAFVIGGLACGPLSQREQVTDLLACLPQATMADHTEVLGFIGTHRLQGRGIGDVDAHRLQGRGIGNVDAPLLTAPVLTPGARLWRRDRRLSRLAGALGIAAAACARPGREPQRCLNTAARFSRNAATPSRASSLVIARRTMASSTSRPACSTCGPATSTQ